MFPSNGVPTRRPLRSPGSLGMVPPLHGYYGALRLPIVRLARLRCLRRSDTTACAVFRAHQPRRSAGGTGELVSRFPSRPIAVETIGPPRFPGGPRGHRPCSSTPVGSIPRFGPSAARSTRPPLLTRTKAPTPSFRGSIARPLTSLSTLRRGGYPPPRKTRFRLLVRLYRAGLVTRRVPTKGFERVLSSFPELSWRKVRSCIGLPRTARPSALPWSTDKAGGRWRGKTERTPKGT
jgi:hypothetical protein